MNSGSVFAGKDAPHRHDIGEADEARNRYEIADEVEVQLLEQRCIYCVHGAAEDERVAVGGGSNGRLGGELAAGARPILHDNRLAKAIRQPLRHDARDDVEVTLLPRRGPDAEGLR